MTSKALITGVTSGIGQAIAKQAHEQAYAVTGIARDFSSFEAPEATLHCSKVFSLDLADLSAVDSYCAAQRESIEALDLLVLNAGYGQFGAIEQFSTAQINALITTNLTANLVLLSHVVPHMKRRGLGDIVLIGSESALDGAKQGSVYCASKFGVRGMAQSLRAECANSGIRVILLNPGPVRSGFFEELDFEPAAGEEFALSPETVAKTVFNALNLDRNAVVDELNIQPLKRVFNKKK